MALVADAQTARIVQSFEGGIRAVGVPLVYRLGLVVVALAMVALPLVYVAVIGLTIYGLWYHAVNHTVLFELLRSWQLGALAYLTPLIVGAILVFFMIKPLFARRPLDAPPRTVERDDEPTLFAFVEKICEVVGSPRPSRINVDFQVNASAGFRRGLISFIGHDMVLTIGLPLVAGMSMRQFAGVLAHEFGHFAQGTGMRLTYVIRSVNYWFHRVVYERDTFDAQLERRAKTGDWRVMFMLQIARAFVWSTRKLLWLLMSVGHAISCFMLRQMEFDADRYEARVAGSDAFESTVNRLHELGYAAQGARNSLGTAFREGRLVDDLPGLIRAHSERIPEEVQAEIDSRIAESKTSWFDTHPSDRDRIDSARAESTCGIFRLEELAGGLFRDLGKLSASMTLEYYMGQIGESAATATLVSIDSLLEVQETVNAAHRSLRRFFDGKVLEGRPIRIRVEIPESPVGFTEAVGQLEQAGLEMKRTGGKAMRAIGEWALEDQRARAAEAAEALISAGVTVRPESFGITASRIDAAMAAASSARRSCEACLEGLEPFRTAAQQRIETALVLLRDPRVASQLVDNDRLVEETKNLVAPLQSLNRVLETTKEFRREWSGWATLMHNLEGHRESEGFVRAIVEQAESLRARLGSLREDLSTAPYPFEHTDKDITLGEYLVSGPLAGAERPGPPLRHHGVDPAQDRGAALEGARPARRNRDERGECAESVAFRPERVRRRRHGDELGAERFLDQRQVIARLAPQAVVHVVAEQRALWVDLHRQPAEVAGDLDGLGNVRKQRRGPGDEHQVG